MQRPAPIVTEDSAAFWDAADEGRLVAQRCAACGRLRHPPRPMCPECNSLEVEVVELSGRGVVYSYALLHHPQHPAFEYPVPAVLVDLDEGIRIVSNVVGVEPGDIRIGLPVHVEFVPTDGEHQVPVFRPVDADESAAR
ncbi:MAG TPA: Zn-ribbon domain-containing OB-fold protein [Acidimicrobiia bacterium]